MPVKYDKTYRPIHLNVYANLLGRLDEYRSASTARSQHIHEAIELYIEHLEQQGRVKNTWSIGWN
jgi:metal-responsive CopG/Arc/MetJ family transcriptional regulator